MKIQITEEMNIQKEWYDKVDQITLEELPGFINHLTNDYEHTYGSISHAMAAAALATLWACSKTEQGGITGYQASWIPLFIIREWTLRNNKCGFMILDYDNLLYPQCQDRFSEIPECVWKDVQKEAQKNLDDRETYAAPAVIRHWQSIVKGDVPFGLTVRYRSKEGESK